MTHSVRPWLCLAIAISLGMPSTRAEPATAPPLRTIEDGLLDEIQLFAESLPAATRIVVRPFDASQADLGTGAEGGKEARVEAVKKIQASGPALLAESLRARLEKLGPFEKIELSADAPAAPDGLVLEGRFTEIDPGSKAKRYWVGFGSGKSGTTVEGVVKDASGNVLATFRQKRIAVMGAFGGDYVAKLTSDCESIGEDIAKFLHAWAAGKPLEH